MPKQNGTAPEPVIAPESEPTPTPTLITEDLTILELAEEATKQRVAAGGKPVPESAVRTALKAHDAFKPEGAVQTRPIKGTKMEVIYVRPDAAQAWIDSLLSKAGQGVERNAGTGIVYRLRIKPEYLEAAQAALSAVDSSLVLERAFKPKAAGEAPEGSVAALAQAQAAEEGGSAQISIDDLFQPEGESVKA